MIRVLATGARERDAVVETIPLKQEILVNGE
jgi:hypothetical protein